MQINAFLRCTVAAALALGAAAPARAAGTTPLALVQQFDQQGQPLAGCLVYFFVAGTVATPQQVYQDFGLTIPAPNPLQCDQSARVPQHWLADGLIHVRLTSAAGMVQLDSTLQVLGPSGGGGGGGGTTVDPTAVASTGDIKFRATGEILPGWVILNATTIGNATSGATQRANADTQNLFVYLWGNCPDPHCPVPGGRGTTALADYNANKQLTLPDLRARSLVGADCMSTTCAGRLLAGNINSGGSDGVDSAGASGGVANQTASTTIAQTNLPSVNFPVSVTVTAGQWSHSHTFGGGGAVAQVGGGAGGTGLTYSTGGPQPVLSSGGATLPVSNPSLTGGGSAASGGTGAAALSAAFSNMPPFVLGSWYQKL